MLNVEYTDRDIGMQDAVGDRGTQLPTRVGFLEETPWDSKRNQLG